MPQIKKEVILFGIPGSPGIAHGTVFRFLHRDVEVPSYQINESERESELERFKTAVDITRAQITEIRKAVSNNLGEKEAGIFDAHLLVLEDQALFDDIDKEIQNSGDNIEQCVFRVTQRYHDYFNQLEDEYLRERAADLKDISKRLLRNLIGETGAGTAFLEEPRVLASEDLSPSDTASLDRNKILGIATDTGGRTGHAVIMARASGVPAVVGLRGLIEQLSDSDTLLIDGFEGVAIINPSETTLFRYGKVDLQRKKLSDLVVGESELPAETKDGTKIRFLVNADSSREVIQGLENKCEGVGLFRTESIFLRKNEIPTEDQQVEDYLRLVSSANGKPVTIRTLDLGGDKILDSIGREKEENPFMGFRAIRYSLRNPVIFLDQLRAILRVSAHSSVHIMFPMISGVGEIIRAKEFLNKAKTDLQDRGIDFDQNIKVGCMIETPSAVTICDMLADEVDFFSVGTNDLVQYLLAVDRINNEISYLYEPHHPAVIRAIEQITRVSKEKNVEVTLCGEIAGDPHFLPLLIGLGVDALSATSTMLPELKFFGRRFTMTEVNELRFKIMEMRRPSRIKECLKSFYEERVSELII
jgi:phosphotransferase system enzyme I (PtsI)